MSCNVVNHEHTSNRFISTKPRLLKCTMLRSEQKTNSSRIALYECATLGVQRVEPQDMVETYYLEQFVQGSEGKWNHMKGLLSKVGKGNIKRPMSGYTNVA